MTEATATFALEGPLDLDLTLRLLRVGPLDPTMIVRSDEAWIAVHPEAGPSALHVRFARGEVHARAIGPAAEWLITQAPRFVGVDYVPRPFDHPKLDEAAQRRLGHRPCVAPVLVDVVVRYVAQQRVTFPDAAAAYRQLVLRFGAPVAGAPDGLRAPPSARTLAKLPYFELHPLGIERRRAETIVAVAKRARRVEALRDADHAEARAKLALFPGVGPWTREMVLGVGLGDFDALPLHDYHLPHLVAYCLAGEERDRRKHGADDEADRRMLELLAPYAGQRFRAVQLLDAFYTSTGGPFRGEPRRGPRHPRLPWAFRSDR
ncbi:MAG: DNA-3-methyladenine glycosylase 2 family protein [Sandaracinus sp.]|nr:DNA-3-methyladenine glycosylase 2 family protein [Sandaracinus sp.]MCB9612037.1 DNA-3-methyladenine glycosylase 2 family protein [Sandaracinus sp.]MCB9633155.1 DNA-3-methyladenine glycosylase 2 family protein [Sandaracinus sp.]